MPTPVQPERPAATPETAGSALLLGSALSAPLPLVARPTPLPWTYLVSEAVLFCADGKILPRLGKASWSPGLGANAPTAPMRHQGAGLVTQLQTHGWRPVGLDVPAIAWGVDRRTVSRDATYLVRHRVIRASDRAEVDHWTDAWTQIASIGGMSRERRDHAGWLSWCESLIPMIGLENGRLSELQIELACDPYLRQIRSLMATPGAPSAARSRVAELLYHLPESVRPPDAVRFATDG